MVLVNPLAFGKYIPTQVTMETARLVHQVAHISSDDWARKYTFHDIMWPRAMLLSSTTTNSTNDDDNDDLSPHDQGFAHMAQSLAHDAVLLHASRVVLNLGCRHPHKTMTLFGNQGGSTPAAAAAATTPTNTTTTNANQNSATAAAAIEEQPLLPPDLSAMYEQCGLIGITLYQILQLREQQQQQHANKFTVSLSMVELLPEDDHLWDWLAAMANASSSVSTNSNNNYNNNKTHPATTHSTSTTSTTTAASFLTKSPLKIRHVDSRGPVLEGLTQLPLDTWSALPHLLRRAFSSRRKRKHQPRGTLLATLHVVHHHQVPANNNKNSNNHSKEQVKDALGSPPPSNNSNSNHPVLSSSSTTTLVQIQFVNLVGLETKKSTDHKDTTLIGGGATSNNANWREYTAARKSLSSLGGVLRRLVERDMQQQQQQQHRSKPLHHDTPARTTTAATTTIATSSNSGIVSYRDSILTKLLQRTLEDPTSRIVVLAHVSPLRDDYDGTVHTLHYVHRFMTTTTNSGGGGGGAKSSFLDSDPSGWNDHSSSSSTGGGGNKPLLSSITSTSTTTMWPFHPRILPTTTSGTTTATGTTSSPLPAEGEPTDSGFFPTTSPILSQMDKRGLMRSYVSDPRQRLAKVFMLNQTPNQKSVTLSPLPPTSLLSMAYASTADQANTQSDQAFHEQEEEDYQQEVIDSQPPDDSINMYHAFDVDDDEGKYHDDEEYDSADYDNKGYDATHTPSRHDQQLQPERPVSPVAKLLDSPYFGMSPLARYLSTSQHTTSEQLVLDEQSEPGSSLGLYGHPERKQHAEEDIFLPEISKSPIDDAAAEASISTYWTSDNDRDEFATSTSTAMASPYATYFKSPKWDLASGQHDEQQESADQETESPGKTMIADYLAGLKGFDDATTTTTALVGSNVDDANQDGVDPDAPFLGDGDDEGVATDDPELENVAEAPISESGKDPRFFTWDFVSSGELQESELQEPDTKSEDELLQNDAVDDDDALDSQRWGLASKSLLSESREETCFRNDSSGHSDTNISPESDGSSFKNTWWKEPSEDTGTRSALAPTRPKFDPDGLVSAETFKASSKRFEKDETDLEDESIQGTPEEVALGSTEMSSLLLRREMSRLESGSLHAGTFSPEDESPNNTSNRLDIKNSPFREIDEMLQKPALPLETSTSGATKGVMDDWVNELELAIGEMRLLHNGVWQNSSLALRRLRVSLLSLQQQLMQTKSERDEARSNVELIRSEIRCELSRHQEAQAEARIFIEELEAKLKKALADRVAVEKIAEEAIASQDSMEKRMSRLKKDVASSHEDATLTKQQCQVLLQEKEEMGRELRSANSQIERLQNEKMEGDSALAKLSIHLQSVDAERQRLLRDQEEDRLSMERLKEALNAQMEGNQASATNELDNLMNERDELEQTVMTLKSEKLRLNEERDAAVTSKAEFETKVAQLQKQVSRLNVVKEEDKNVLLQLRSELLLSKQACDAALSSKSTLEAEAGYRNKQLTSLRQECERLENALSQQQEANQHIVQERDVALASKVDLEARVTALKNQVPKLRDEYAAKESAVSKEMVDMLHVIEERNVSMKRLKQEISRLQETSGSTAAMQAEHHRLCDELSKMAAELSHVQSQWDEATARESVWQQERQDLLNKLSQSNQAVTESKEHADHLQRQLEMAKSKREKAEERARSMRAELSAFQEETRAKVQQVLEHKDANTVLLEKMTDENVTLLDTNRQLRSKLDALLNEQRDAESRRFGVLFESWDSVAPGSSGGGDGSGGMHVRAPPTMRTPSAAVPPFRLYDVPPAAAARATTAPASHTSDAAAAATFTNYSLVASSLRAEEICSAIALSAKSALEQSQHEVMKWKMRLLTVEDEKEAEIAMLRAKIRTLERYTTDADGGRRPTSYYYNS